MYDIYNNLWWMLYFY